MPYIIETKTPATPDVAYFGDGKGRLAQAFGVQTARVAVATLDEAREAAHETTNQQVGRDGAYIVEHFHDAIRALPDEGGKIGPLPDGTVIEVRRVPWKAIGWHYPLLQQETIDAYNAR